MRHFALKDSNDRDLSTLAVLSYYAAEDEYYLDMPADTDPWTVPFVLSSFASRGEWAVDAVWSKRWVESRLVPPSRQNLGEVLRENGLKSYDTLRLLEMTSGRNSQDDCYLEPLTPGALPKWLLEREAGRVVEAFALRGSRLLVAFRTGEARLYNSEELVALDAGVTRIVADESAFSRVAVSAGGRGVRWGEAIRLSDGQLNCVGTPLPLSWDDLADMAPAMLVDATEAAAMLGCTRQNLHALVKRGSLNAVKASGKATLFLRADVRARASRA